jgi:hypothetical protein
VRVVEETSTTIPEQGSRRRPTIGYDGLRTLFTPEPFAMTPLQSLAATGTKLWLDSVDPDLIKLNRSQGATGATSNPIIISDLLKTGRFDEHMKGSSPPGTTTRRSRG